jgi:hypothetical protein
LVGWLLCCCPPSDFVIACCHVTINALSLLLPAAFANRNLWGLNVWFEFCEVNKRMFFSFSEVN